MSRHVSRITDEMIRAIVGLAMFATLMALDAISGVILGPVSQRVETVVFWTLVTPMAFVLLRLVHLIATERALRPRR